MVITCYNARLIGSGERVGIFVIGDPVREHPDKHEFEALSYSPVWAMDAYKVWVRWQHFRWDHSYRLPPFQAVQESGEYRLLLKVHDFVARGYDPYLLSRWIWGVDVSREMVSAWLGRGITSYWPNMGHSAKIAVLCVSGLWKDPIQVMQHQVGKSEYAVGDGTHRFAAASYRRLGLISAVATFAVRERLIADGLAIKAY